MGNNGKIQCFWPLFSLLATVPRPCARFARQQVVAFWERVCAAGLAPLPVFQVPSFGSAAGATPTKLLVSSCYRGPSPFRDPSKAAEGQVWIPFSQRSDSIRIAQLTQGTAGFGSCLCPHRHACLQSREQRGNALLFWTALLACWSSEAEMLNLRLDYVLIWHGRDLSLLEDCPGLQYKS